METARCSKRATKPNTKYINETFKTEQKKKPVNSRKNCDAETTNIKKKALVPKKTVLKVKAPKSTQLPKKTFTATSASKVAISKPVAPKKVKYRIDFTSVADLVAIPDFHKFFLEEMKKNESGRETVLKERKLQVIVKCKKFLKKEDVRIVLKKFLKKLNIVHLTKVTSTSKSVYTVLMK